MSWKQSLHFIYCNVLSKIYPRGSYKRHGGLSKNFLPTMKKAADRSGCGLRPLVCWECGFESRRGHGSLSHVFVVCCQIEAF